MYDYKNDTWKTSTYLNYTRDGRQVSVFVLNGNIVCTGYYSFLSRIKSEIYDPYYDKWFILENGDLFDAGVVTCDRKLLMYFCT